jgi:hypothetical protein
MKLTLASIVTLLMFIAAPAHAQVSTGVRVGASANPDQFFFGGHVESKELVENVYFRPNVEVGIGNDLTVIALNFELAYKFPTKQPWRPYVVAGPALNIIDTSADTGAHGGFNIGLGVEHRSGLFGEVKVGMIDSPDFKIGFGIRFKP